MNNKELEKMWISFLKRNQIVDQESDPKTGLLRYRKKVNVATLTRFLKAMSNFSNTDIDNAINTVLAKRGITSQPALSDNNQAKDEPDITDVEYTERKRQPNSAQQSGQLGNQSKQSANQANEYQTKQADSPRQPKPHYKMKSQSTNGKPGFVHKGLREEFRDITGEILSEKDIEDIFNLLLSIEPASVNPSHGEQSTEVSKQEKLRNVKELIRKSMSPSQRKALWRALNET